MARQRLRVLAIPGSNPVDSFSYCSVLHGYLVLWACRQFVLSACLAIIIIIINKRSLSLSLSLSLSKNKIYIQVYFLKALCASWTQISECLLLYISTSIWLLRTPNTYLNMHFQHFFVLNS